MPEMNLADLVRMGDDVGVKLELVRGIGVWEALPTKRHQRELYRIQSSIQPMPGQRGCGCYHYSDVLIRFSADTKKRPDIAVFCTDPPEEDEAITMVPAAVIEIVSLGYEAKDLEQAPSLYLSFGVQDVIIFDPRSKDVIQHRTSGAQRHVSPVTLDLECGCRVTV